MSARGLVVAVLTSALALGAVFPASAGSEPVPTSRPGSRAVDVWRPAPGTTWQWQITGVVDPTRPVDMYDVDLFEAGKAVFQVEYRGDPQVFCPKVERFGFSSMRKRLGLGPWSSVCWSR